MNLIDIHCHILPKVDDGPDSVEESLKILKDMRRQGIKHVIVTPHYRPEMFEPSMKRVIYSYRHLRDIAYDMGVSMSLGCEYYRNEQIIEHMDNRKRPAMAGSRYVLIEFSMNDLFPTIRNYVYELITHGYQPIIAHVERYFCCQKMEKIQELKNMGALVQVNAGSVLGEEGWKLRKFCLDLMKKDLVDFVASDTHNTSDRKLNLKKCASFVTKKMGKQYAERIFFNNPLNILKNR
ncbi:CpsB/CapC family capsule biosynthesis tyrosine phosphatase [Bariatricus sp. HCP28S3_A7]|uniref:CpsB/CapC family capsule biosynthesis tyrosine phosphatase n=1 Tax=Bariatricus sp. HCP28S3_A7 TaxID=3438894 RepID=UPI003F8BE4D6